MKKFVLSDGSVNVYGFRLPTETCRLDSFVANPIGYYMHNRELGVILKWTDIKIENQAITCSPEFDLKDELGLKISNKVEGGFLKCASIGALVHQWAMGADEIPYAADWSAIEGSIVDRGGNKNAVVLYDADKNIINLEDAGTLFKLFEDLKPTTNTTMEIKLNADVQKLLQLNDTSDSAAINAAISSLHSSNVQLQADKEALQGDKTKLEGEVKELKKEGGEVALNALLDGAIAKGKITNPQRDFYKKLAGENGENIDTLKSLLESLPEHKTLANDTPNANDAELVELRKLSYDELSEKDKLETLMEKDFQSFNEKHKEKWGREYTKK